MFKRTVAHAVLRSRWFRGLVSQLLPQIVKYRRGEFSAAPYGLRILSFSYSLSLLVASTLLYPWTRLKLLVAGVIKLHIECDILAAVDCFQRASTVRAPYVDSLAVNLARIEFAAHTTDSSSNSLILLTFADNLVVDGDTRYQLALAQLLCGDVTSAGKSILEAIQLRPDCAMAHQNMAAKYDRSQWMPEPLDLLSDLELHLYSAYHLLGQQLVNIGDAERGHSMFGAAMTLQNKLAYKYELPWDLLSEIASHPGYRPDKPVRIIPYEWVTQIGHLGMLDALIKMSKLGMRPDANWTLLAPDDKVVNQEYLDCWMQHILIIRDAELVKRLFPYQRICGEQFNCYVGPDGRVMDWSDAAAQAFVEWDRRKLGPLVSPSLEVQEFGRSTLEALGVPRDAWFVALHARSSGFYGEGLGFIQRHRNAPLSSYLQAIDCIVSHGGWVIRMGDPSMPKLSHRKNVIDIAHSPLRSKKLDVFLWSGCRFFIGTTSGPTNPVISFHTPALLVNCVSNYAQSWNRRVRYVLKPFWSVQQSRFLTYAETFVPSVRASMFNARSMAAQGLVPRSNSSRDILVATEEIMLKVQTDSLDQENEVNPMNNLNIPIWLWGSAVPSQNYLSLHPELLLTP